MSSWIDITHYRLFPQPAKPDPPPTPRTSQRGVQVSEPPAYDSRADILAHIHHVRDHLSQFATELLQRGAAHDASKLTQAEKPAFDLVTPLLPNIAYGSPEYRALEDRV